MISMTKNQVPDYLSTSDFFNSLSSDDSEEFSIPSAFFKPTPSLVTIPEDLSHLLHTIKFWGLKRFPRELMDFLLTKPASLDEYEQVCSVLPEFDADFNLSVMYNAIFYFDVTRGGQLTAAALCGREDILEYLVSNNKKATLALVKEAAEYGLIELLQRTVAELRTKNKKDPFSQVSLKKVTSNGHSGCLRFLLEQGCVPERGVCLAAAEHGHLDCLQVAHEHQCEWDCKAIHAAALRGHLSCLTYLLAQGCPLDRTSAYNAALNGHFDCLSLLLDHDAPLAKRVCNAATMNGHLNCLKLLVERGCPWDKECARLAVTHNHFDCLQFAVENGCRCDSSVADAAASGGKVQFLEYLLSADKPASHLAVDYAAMNGHTECLQLLFNAGVEWDSEDGFLKACLRQRNDYFVRRLVDVGYTLPSYAASQAAEFGCEKSLLFICSLHLHPLTAQDAALAAKNGHLACLQVLHAHDCPWDADTYTNAATFGRLECLKFAHEHGCPHGSNDNLCDTAAEKGHLSVLEYLHSQGHVLTVETCLSAIRGRILPCLRFAVEHGAPVDDVRLCAVAAAGRATNEHSRDKTLAILRYLHEEAHCPWDEACPAAATKGMDCTVLQYIHQQGCPWDMLTTTTAVQTGSLCCLQYALAQGCPCSSLICVVAARTRSGVGFLKALHEHGCSPWNGSITKAAAAANHLEVLQYAHEQGCPWDADTMAAAAENGHMRIVEYAHAHGCPWNARTAAAAAGEKGSLAMLQYLHTHGCPWDARTTEAAAARGDLYMLVYAHLRGCPWDESVSCAAFRHGLSEEHRLEENECMEYCLTHGCPIPLHVKMMHLAVKVFRQVQELV